MTDKEIIRHIDDGANFYISLFGNAEHMEIVDRTYYRYIKPKTAVHGISFIYDIHLDNIPLEQAKMIVSDIKSLNMPFWLNLSSSDELFRLFFGKNREHGQTEFRDNDEIYMALLPSHQKNYKNVDKKIIKVQSADEFAVWADINNGILAGGLPDMHPIYHYPLCRKGVMKCYVVYEQEKPVAVSAIMDNHGIASLEFVATVPELRRKGYAKAACEKAIQDAFENGVKIITVRAINLAAAKLYESLGFRAYNYVL